MSVLLVIAGPSGVGKGTIVRRLLERNPEMWLSISATTRKSRSGEEHGREYWFLSPEEFEQQRDAGQFLESFNVFDAKYGTPRGPVEERLAAGQDVVFEIDVKGAQAIKAAYPEALTIFIKPPSREVLRKRLHDRDPSADADELDRRLAEADAEEALATAFDHTVVNDDLDRAVEEVQAAVDAART
ncbi:MAG: guanylate kinase [Actinobacteria bacterium]|nr:guanylate kinase [Actinomycetota bacterium]